MAGTTVEQLNVQITSDSTSAVNSIDALIASLERLNNVNLTGIKTSLGALKRVQTGSITGSAELSKSISAIGKAVTEHGAAFNQLAGIAQNLSSFATALPTATAGVETLGSISKSISAIGKIDPSKFLEIGVGMHQLSVMLSGTQLDEKTLAALNSLAGVIASLASRTSKRYSSDFEALATGLDRLLQVLARAPNISTNTIRALEAIGKMDVETAKAARGFTRLGNTVSTTSKHLSLFHREAQVGGRGISGMTTRLAFTIGKFRQIGHMVSRISSFFGKMVESSMEYVETLNYFQAAFAQVASRATDVFGDAGEEAGRAFSNRFAEEAEKLTEKMSGYRVDESGMVTNTMGTSLGMNPAQMMNYQATFAQMASSMGVSSDMATDLSRALTEIGADLASVKNLDFEDTWQNLQSGLVGMSRAVDKYGLNIRNVNLQNKLLSLGINANIQNLNQQDKALLRTIIILENSQYAWGDLADTLQQPANQMRMLRSGINNLGRTIGNLFTPVVAMALPYINAFVIALQKLFETLVNIIGMDFDWGSLGGGGALNSDWADYLEETSSGFSDAAESAEEFKAQILGFDEINKLGSESSDSKSSGASSGSNPFVTGALEGALSAALEQYQRVWDASYADVDNKVNELAQRIVDAFKKGDFEAIGQSIGNWIADGLGKINWEKVKTFASNVSSKLADFLNGAISPDTFGAIGTTVAEFINTAIELKLGFNQNFDWENFGTSLGAGLSNFLTTFSFDKWALSFTTFVGGIASAIASAAQRMEWATIGANVGSGLSTLLTTFPFSEIVQAFNEFATGFGTAVGTALGEVEWGTLIKNVVEAALKLNPVAIAITLGTLTFKALAADALTKLKSGFLAVIGGVFKLGSVVIKLGALSFKELTQDAATKLKSGFLAVLQKGFSLGGLTAAIGAAALITTVALGIKVQLDREEALYDELAPTTSALNDAVQSLKDFQTEAENTMNSSAVKGEWLDDVATRYYELSQKVGLTGTEEEELRKLAGKLAQENPAFLDLIDAQTSRWGGTYEQLSNLVKKTQEYYLLQALESIKGEYSAEQYLAEFNMYKAQQEVDDIQSQYDAKLREIETLTKKYGLDNPGADAPRTTPPELQRAQAEARDLWNVLNRAKGDLDGYTKEWERTKKQYDQLESWAQHEINEINGITGAVEAATRAFNDADYTQFIQKTSDAIDKVGGIWTQGPDGGWTQLGAAASISVYQAMMDGKLKNLGNGMYQLADGSVVSFGNGLSEGVKSEQFKSMEDMLVNEPINALKYSYDQWKEAGGYVVEGLGEGLTQADPRDKVKKNSLKVAKELYNEIATYYDINSPSGTMKIAGGYIVEGLAQGLAPTQGLRNAANLLAMVVYNRIGKGNILANADVENVATDYAGKLKANEKLRLASNNFVNFILARIGRKNVGDWTDVPGIATDYAKDLKANEKLRTSSNNFADFILARIGKDNILWWAKVAEISGGYAGDLQADQTLTDAADTFAEKIYTPMSKDNVLKEAAVGDIPGAVGEELSKENIKKALEGVKDGFKEAFDKAGDAAIESWNKTAKELNKAKVNDKVVFTASTVSTPQRTESAYANGGFPEDGLFWANHTELVGRFTNGRTAVANNEQIIEGIQGGVARGMAEAIMATGAVRGGTNGQPVQVVINVDSEQLYRTTLRGEQKYNNRYNLNL